MNVLGVLSEHSLFSVLCKEFSSNYIQDHNQTMVQKCCVPQCASTAKTPGHGFPKDVARAEAWLRIIERQDLIGSSTDVMKKLRICGLHFADEMIMPYTSARCLKHNAIPSEYLPQFNIEDCSNVMYHNIDHIQDDQDVTMAPQSEPSKIEDNHKVDDEMSAMTNLKLSNKAPNIEATSMNRKIIANRDLRHLKKMLQKETKTITRLREMIRRLKHKNSWEILTKDLNFTQATFMEMVNTNMRKKPQVALY